MENLNIDVIFFSEYLVKVIYDTSDFDINNVDELKVSPLKLQHLLYCVYIYALTIWNKKLWANNFEKWAVGPIIPEVYDSYSRKGLHVIDKNKVFIKIPELKNIEKLVLSALTIDLNKKYSDAELAKLTRDYPWHNTKVNSKIKDEDISRYYSENETFFDDLYDPSLEPKVKFLS